MNRALMRLMRFHGTAPALPGVDSRTSTFRYPRHGQCLSRPKSSAIQSNEPILPMSSLHIFVRAG